MMADTPSFGPIHLTITDAYAKTWGSWEGVREFIQNWYDGVLGSYETCSPPNAPMRKSFKIVPGQEEDFFEAKLYTTAPGKEPEEIATLGSLNYNKDSKRLVLVNRNTQLETKILLLGYSDKRTHHDIIGQFGEGLKIGTLALLRNQQKVLVATHNCSWRFSLEKHPHFNETVLTVNLEEQMSNFSSINPSSPMKVTSGDTYSQIWPIEEVDWAKWVKRFLFLTPPTNAVETELGTLLLDDSLKGQLFVKQVWLTNRNEKEEKERLRVGVNFKELEIDRDRRAVVYESEIDHNVGCMWSKALKRRPDLVSMYYQMLEKGEHSADTRLATYYLDDMQVTGMIAEEFFKQHGDNAVPIPNSSTADKLSYLHKELQEKVVLCNQTLIDILHRSGKVRRVDDIMAQNAPHASIGRVYLKNIPEDQFPVLTEAEYFVKLVAPNFSADQLTFYKGEEQYVTYVNQPIGYEVPTWMLNADRIHHLIACPATSPDSCHCASAFLCERLLSAMGSRRNDGGDKKLQTLLMVFALQIKGKEPKQIPKMSSIEELLKKDDEERDRTIKFLQQSFSEEKEKHKQELDELKKQLNSFQSDLAKEDIRFVEREQDLIERQKQERDSIRQMFEEQMQNKKREFDDLKEDFSHVSGELQNEKRRKVELEEEMKTVVNSHKNELTRLHQETDFYVQRLGKSIDQVTKIRYIAKKGSELKKSSEVAKILVGIRDKIETDSKMDNCIVCLTSRKNCVFQPCRECITCMRCAANLTNCPSCLQENVERRQNHSY